MDIKDLPESELVALAANKMDLSLALRQASPSTFFTHYDIIREGPRSGRIFSYGEIGEGIPLDGRAQTPEGLAEALMTEANEARYYPKPPHTAKVKGWEIRVATLNRRTVAIAWAAWV